MTLEEDLINAMELLDEEKSLEIVQKLIKDKPATEVFTIMRKGMKKIGEKFANKEYFLADLIYSAELFQELNNVVMPLIKEKKAGAPLGKIVFGTVKNDIHDIGKNIVISLLRAEGFEVIDLGVDIPADKFIEAIKTEQPQAVGLSGLLTIVIEEMKKTIEAIRATEGNENLKIIVGGGPVDQHICKYVGADDWAKDAVEAVKIFIKYID